MRLEESCLERNCHALPFVRSMDVMLGQEVKSFTKHLAAKLAGKWEKWYPQVCGLVNSLLSIAIVHTMHICTMRGSQEVPVRKISILYLQWEKDELSYYYLNVDLNMTRPWLHAQQTWNSSSNTQHYHTADPQNYDIHEPTLKLFLEGWL